MDIKLNCMALPQSSFRLCSSNTAGSVKALSVLLCNKYCVFLFSSIRSLYNVLWSYAAQAQLSPHSAKVFFPSSQPSSVHVTQVLLTKGCYTIKENWFSPTQQLPNVYSSSVSCCAYLLTSMLGFYQAWTYRNFVLAAPFRVIWP